MRPDPTFYRALVLKILEAYNLAHTNRQEPLEAAAEVLREAMEGTSDEAVAWAEGVADELYPKPPRIEE